MTLNALGEEHIFRTHECGWASLSSVQQPFGPLPIEYTHQTSWDGRIISKIMDPFLTLFKQLISPESSSDSQGGEEGQTGDGFLLHTAEGQDIKHGHGKSGNRNRQELTSAGFVVELFFKQLQLV